jgi:hypothetical protein
LKISRPQNKSMKKLNLLILKVMKLVRVEIIWQAIAESQHID